MDAKVLRTSEKKRLCKEHFEKVAEILTADGLFEVIDSPYSKDKYLVPSGTANQITFYGKPVGSIRLSNHWNWFETLDRCDENWFVQCRNIDMPRARKRTEHGMATEPRYGWQCAIFCADGKYRAAYGDIFNRHTKEWTFLDDATPEDTAEIVKSVCKMWYKERKLAI